MFYWCICDHSNKAESVSQTILVPEIESDSKEKAHKDIIQLTLVIDINLEEGQK